jgi:hypothetical protein
MNKWILLGWALLPLGASAQVTFNIDAEKLKDENGTAMPLTGLVILAASTTDSIFTPPTAGAFFPGADDIEIMRWNLQGSAFGPGIFSDSTGSQNPSGNWNAGDPVQLYWFPSLTTASTAPGSGTRYGTFTDSIGHDGGDAWKTPASGTPLTSLKFFTKDSSVLFPTGAGFFDPPAGNSSLTVVPEPSEYAALLGLGCLGWAMLSRKIRKI